MKRGQMFLPLCGLLLAFGGPVTTPEASAKNLDEAFALAAAEAAMFVCGAYLSCVEGHEISDLPPFPEWDGTHECWPGIGHSGPMCGGLVRLHDLLESSPDEVRDLVATNPGVVANVEMERVETFDCGGELLAAASFRLLGVVKGDFVAD